MPYMYIHSPITLTMEYISEMPPKYESFNTLAHIESDEIFNFIAYFGYASVCFYPRLDYSRLLYNFAIFAWRSLLTSLVMPERMNNSLVEKGREGRGELGGS